MTGTWGDGVWGDGVWGKGPLSTWIPADNEPVGLSATVLAGPKVRLAWTEGGAEQEGDGFKVYRSANGGADQLMDTVALDVLQWDDESVSVGNKYAYTVYEYKDVYLSDGASVAALLPLHEESVGVSASKLNSVERPVVAEVGMSATTPRIASRSLPSEWTDLCDGDRRDILRSFDILGIGMAPSRSRVWELSREHTEEQPVSDERFLRVLRDIVLELDVAEETSRFVARLMEGDVSLSELQIKAWQLARIWTGTVELDGVLDRAQARGFTETIGVVGPLTREVWRDLLEAIGTEEAKWYRLERELGEELELDSLDSRGVARQLIEMLADMDAQAVKGNSRYLDEALDPLDGDRRYVEREKDEELDVASLHSCGVARSLVEALSSMEAETIKLASRDLLESLGVEDASPRGVERQWEEDLDVEWAYYRDALRDLTESMPIVLADSRHPSRIIPLLLSVSEETDRVLLWDRVFDETVETLDGDRRNALRLILETIGIEGPVSKDAVRSLDEILGVFEVEIRDLARELVDALTVEAESDRVWEFLRVLEHGLSVDGTFSRVWNANKTQAELFRVLSRLSVPGGSTGYPWDVPPFETRAGTMRLRRNGALWILSRTPVTGKLKREAILSSLGGGA